VYGQVGIDSSGLHRQVGFMFCVNVGFKLKWLA